MHAVVRVERRAEGPLAHAHRGQVVQVPGVRQHVHDQRQPEAPHVHPQRGPAIHVSVLPEDLQDVRQLQETHEDPQVRFIVSLHQIKSH